MAEYVRKKEVLEALCTCECEDKMECLDYVLINNLPTMDIVRCSECIHLEENIKKHRPNMPLTWICEGQGIDGFCSDGEREE